MVFNIYADISKSIVSVYVTSQKYLLYTPWQKSGIVYKKGNGAVISDNSILVPSFLVADSTVVEVSKNGSGKRWKASVFHVDTDAGLAIINIDNKDFFSDLLPVDISQNLNLQDNVSICQWNDNGQFLNDSGNILSFKAGKIDSSYNYYLYTIASVNLSEKKSSNELVFLGEKLCGISFYYNDNKIQFRPLETIKHYIDDVLNGDYKGFAVNHISYRNSNNEYLREYLKVDENNQGIFYSGGKNSPYSDVLKKNDFIYEINNMQIDNNGNINDSVKGIQPFYYLITRFFPGDKVNLKILRNGKKMNFNITLDSLSEKDFLIPDEKYNTRSNYFVYGGIMFSELSKNMLEAYGKDWEKKAPKELVILYKKNYMKKTLSDDKIVLVNKVFPDDINKSYQNYYSDKIKIANGEEVKNLKHLKEILQKDGEFDVIELDYSKGKIVFDKKQLKERHIEILKNYNITESEYIAP